MVVDETRSPPFRPPPFRPPPFRPPQDGGKHVINHFVPSVYVFTLGTGHSVALYFTMLHVEF